MDMQGFHTNLGWKGLVSCLVDEVGMARGCSVPAEGEPQGAGRLGPSWHRELVSCLVTLRERQTGCVWQCYETPL